MARKNNGQRFGPRSHTNQRGGLRSVPDTRVVYGVRCTWWGSIHDTKVLRQLPVCPNCLRPLMEVPNEESFWAAVKAFEDGKKGVSRPHPGYADFMKWMKRRCFIDIRIATTAYTVSTGKKVDLDESDFADPATECTCQPGDEEACPFCLEQLGKRQDELEMKEKLDG